MSADSPYPEMKKGHTMARTGPAVARLQAAAERTGVGDHPGRRFVLDAGRRDRPRRVRRRSSELGPTTIEPLAAHLDVSAPHLQHLCDALVSFGFLDQVDEVYELTETAERYLCTDGPASMAALVRVAPGPLRQLGAAGRHGAHRRGRRRRSRTTRLRSTAHSSPRRSRRSCAPRADWACGSGWARRPGLRVLDLGAGRAPWAIAVLEQSPGSTAVVNDLARRGRARRADDRPNAG